MSSVTHLDINAFTLWFFKIAIILHNTFCKMVSLWISTINLPGICYIISCSLSGPMTYLQNVSCTMTHSDILSSASLRSHARYFQRSNVFSGYPNVQPSSLIQTKCHYCLPQLWICSREFAILCSCAGKIHNSPSP